MKCIIWGTGFYCKKKIPYIENTCEIVAYVERDRTIFRGRETILPEEMKNFQYDNVIVLSSHYLDIIPEMLNVYGVDRNKIIPGIECRPYMSQELEVMSEHAKIEINQDGTLLYVYNNKEQFIISKKEDWDSVKNLLCCEENSKRVGSLELFPVGKLFGGPRGGSICRYYINKFLEKNKSRIRGKVLEIGDRTYTQQFGAMVEESYCLHFDKTFESDSEQDFYGDLRDGTGLEEEFYDCIILTQVLNFVEDIRYTPEILIKSLKPNGTLLITTSGITPISRFDMDRWGHFWNFTDAGLRQMFSMENTECYTETYGNFKVACAFLGGMSYTELSEQELTYTDEDFQVFVMAVVQKK